MKPVTMYTKATCPYCNAAKKLFDSLSVPYTDIDVMEHPDKRAEMSEKHNWYTVPMIFVGDEFIGGYDDMHALHEAGQLLPKLND